MDREKLTAKRKDLEDGIKGLQDAITRGNAVIQQAQANIFANQGAIQLIDSFLAEPVAEAAPQAVEDEAVLPQGNVVPIEGAG